LGRGRGEILVVGLGRFGSALAETLATLGHEVMGVDLSADLVQRSAAAVSQTVQADATDVGVMRQLGADEFETGVVAIGDDMEASILASSVLLELGIQRVWAKAITARHGQILQRLGVHRVVFPEHDMGVRVGHALTGRTLDYISLDPDFVLAETTVPRELDGKALGQAQVRSRHDVTVVCVKPPGGRFQAATPETVVNEGDLLLVVGEVRPVDAFCRLA
jgi:trk system potassium uptake protein TrkA